jgi:hypothetical protein
MNKSLLTCLLGLGTVLLCQGKIIGQPQNTTGNPTVIEKRSSETTTTTFPTGLPIKPPVTPVNPENPCLKTNQNGAGEIIRLFYLRQAKQMVQVLQGIQKTAKVGSDFQCLLIQTRGDNVDNEIIIYGTDEGRKIANRIIARLDLPLPGIAMEMWGIQISSNDPDDMSKVMIAVHQDIDTAQQLVREIYNKLQRLSLDLEPDLEFKTLLEEKLEYNFALEPRGARSLTDILVRMIATKNPADDLSNMANELRKEIEADDRYKYYREYLRQQGKQPFERFFRNRGLQYTPCPLAGVKTTSTNCGWSAPHPEVLQRRAIANRIAILDFALVYSWMQHKPESFDPYLIQHTAENLNYPLQNAADDLNQDMQDMFIKPTLAQIQRRARRFRDVSYAQIGKTSVASLTEMSKEVPTYKF